ncbi:MAG: hypothetical protein ACRED3_09950 [Bradyrhizobium sp.]
MDLNDAQLMSSLMQEFCTHLFQERTHFLHTQQNTQIPSDLQKGGEPMTVRPCFMHRPSDQPR